MTENVLLAAHMTAAGLTQCELAQRLNVHGERLTGKPANVTDRHIRNWLTGKTRWPQERLRLALEAEFGVPILDLGFVPRSSGTTSEGGTCTPASEDSVKRRTFTTATASLTAAMLPAPMAVARPRVGMRDVRELETAFGQLVAADNSDGGTIKLETRALAFAQHALERQTVGSATDRVRSHLYRLAAAFTGTALWAAVDDRRPDRAQRHLERALTLAGLSGNEDVKLRLWSHASLLAAQRPGGSSEAIAAAQVARSSPACRRDPLYASLAAARLAGVHSQSGEERIALRTLDQARAAFDRADLDLPRPAWIAFFDEAELHGLSGLITTEVGRHSEAEAQFHRALSRLRPQYRRNRTYYTVHLALAQLRQGAVDQACTTALTVLPGRDGGSLTGRIDRLFARFDRIIETKRRPASAAEWTERYTERVGRRT
ncbi:hypothetical protein ACFQ61_13280 [Streptomyces sp. NPDC056500]|uniref:hypothetical protein n=1 Tax=Streptomyces sp. NPDC056500 TaxID=3345840 RepID=UPI0036A9AF62